jgi:P2-related tail formation protein
MAPAYHYSFSTLLGSPFSGALKINQNDNRGEEITNCHYKKLKKKLKKKNRHLVARSLIIRDSKEDTLYLYLISYTSITTILNRKNKHTHIAREKIYINIY